MDEYINAAVEQFRELLCQQAARQERMEKNAPAKDFSTMEKTTENRRKKAGLSAPEKAAGRMGK